MFNVDRFEKIFASAKSTRQRQTSSDNSTPSNQQKRKIRSVCSEPRKRKQPVDKELSKFSLNVTFNKTPNFTPYFSPKACLTQSPLSRLLNNTNEPADNSTDSPDKRNILPHLSCRLEDFENSPDDSPENRFEESFNSICDKQNKFAKRLDLLDPDAYSPNIEDFSESEDIFKTSQSRFFIAETNKELVDIYQQKPKYKPIQKVPKVGGLMEKLRSMKNKRSSNVCSFAKANEIDEDTKKIEVLEYSAQCRRLIVKFKFIDEPPDPDHDHHNFFYVSSDFINLFCKQVIYEVVFNLPATREITENNFVYFLKLIRASQTY